MPAHVFLDGSVYSPVDPFATALVINEGQVEWVGQDAGARSILDDSMELIELDGALIAPSFSLAAAAVSAADAHTLIPRAKAAGYGELNLMTDSQALRGLPRESGLAINVFLGAETLVQSEEATQDARGIYFTDETAAHLNLLPEAAARQLTVSASFTEEGNLSAFIAALKELEPLERLRIAPRIDGLSLVSEQLLEEAKALSITLGFTSDYAAAGQSLGRAFAAGVSVTLGSDPLSAPLDLGWELVSAAVNAPGDAAVSARAAFQSMTRGVQRANGAANPMAGQLVPGTQADFALWQVTELMVQTPDSRISAWSTDPRARTPLLPALAADVQPPTLTALYRAGKALG